MRALLLLLITLLAGPAFAAETGAPIACKEDNTDCREECTIEYGSSTRTYRKLGTCLQKCTRTYDKCRERHFALQKRQKEGLEPPSSNPAAPLSEEPRSEQAATPASRSESGEPSVRSGVYRASESKAATEPEPAPEPKAVATPESQVDPADELAKAMDPVEPAKPEPVAEPATAAAKPDPAVDEEPLSPPTPPKVQPKPKPAKPKKDIDDWDPNAD